MNVRVFQPEARVDIRSDFVVCLDNILDIYVHEVIERVKMLLYKAFDL